MAFKYRDKDGKACSKAVYEEQVMDGLIVPGDNIEVDQPKPGLGLSDEELAAMPTSTLEKLQAYMSHMLSGPVMSTMWNVNKDAAALAARNRIGHIINAKLREGVLRKILPPTIHPLMLDSATGAGLTDLGVSNFIMAVCIMFGDKLPGKFGEYGMVLARCSTTAAYTDTFGSFEFEKFFDQFVSSEMLELLGEAKKMGA